MICGRENPAGLGLCQISLRTVPCALSCSDTLCDTLYSVMMINGLHAYGMKYIAMTKTVCYTTWLKS